MGASSSYAGYSPSYSYQQPSGRDNYGSPVYDRILQVMLMNYLLEEMHGGIQHMVKI